ncbi:signaling protein [Streptomyces sp. NBC_00859]|uniref:phage baseplate protein n=1 Tax=Streptomyces sp. NBC_00859 TaxID=2903682 RepID=UPI00386353E4|nr:signaling protein [Streptomyces sp. NBC_00859]
MTFSRFVGMGVEYLPRGGRWGAIRFVERQRNYSRRTALWAGVSAAAAAGGLAGGQWYADHRSDRDGTSEPVDTSQILAPTPLHQTTVPQSFAFDDSQGDIYAVQLVQGGVRLPGEPRRLTSTERDRRGDLCVTRLSAGGRTRGHMFLRGFGHGVSLGVEPSAAGALLWTESQAHPETGYGQAITRFAFRDGAVLDSGHPGLRHHRPVPGSVANQPSVDMAARRVMVSYWTVPAYGERQQWYAVYDMDSFLAGRYEPLHAARQRGRGADETFQGCVLHGDRVYQLAGNAYTSVSGTNPADSGGNTRVTAVDLRGGAAPAPRRITSGAGLAYREPEGLAVTLAGRPRLCVGFATGGSRARMLAVHSCGRV